MSEDAVPPSNISPPRRQEDAATSLHYVDGSGEPIDVRGWYKSWVITLAAISIVAGYNVFADGHRRSFAVGASAGISAIAACLAAAYIYAGWSDRRRALESRQYWVRRNVRGAKAMVRVAGLLALPLAVVLFAALDGGRDFLAGLSVGPAIATAALLALGLETRQKQRAKGLG